MHNEPHTSFFDASAGLSCSAMYAMFDIGWQSGSDSICETRSRAITAGIIAEIMAEIARAHRREHM